MGTCVSRPTATQVTADPAILPEAKKTTPRVGQNPDLPVHKPKPLDTSFYVNVAILWIAGGIVSLVIAFIASMFFSSLVACGVWTFCTLLQVIATGVMYAKATWKEWLEFTLQDAFKTLDMDNSGSVDKAELYAGVLLMYVKVPVPVAPPARAEIFALQKTMDHDDTGTLDYIEFKQIMELLSGQLLLRTVVQAAFTGVAPLVALQILRVTTFLVAQGTPTYVQARVPADMWTLLAKVPQELPEGIVTAMLMLAVPVIFKGIQEWTSKEAAIKRKSLIKVD